MSEQTPDQPHIAQPPPPPPVMPPPIDSRSFTPSGLSIAAFVLGILSFVTCGPCFGIPALIVGLIELQKIRNLASPQEGRAFALTGVILGAISSALALLLIAFYVVMIAIFIFAELASSF